MDPVHSALVCAYWSTDPVYLGPPGVNEIRFASLSFCTAGHTVTLKCRANIHTVSSVCNSAWSDV